MDYLINCEYFNNLNGDMYYGEYGDGTNMYISYPSTYPIEKVGDSPYPYPVNVGIPCQNENRFGQYPRGYIYLSSLIIWSNHMVLK